MFRRSHLATFLFILTLLISAFYVPFSAKADEGSTSILLVDQTGILDAGDFIEFTIELEATQGAVLTVSASCEQARFRPRIRVRNMRNETVLRERGFGRCGDAAESIAIYESGTYTVRLRNLAHRGSGEYHLMVSYGYDFSGPALPEARNLVLFYNETAILNGPNGQFTGEAIKACTTAFVITEEAGFGELFVMGGWVPSSAWLDVPEDYGQNGDVAPGCEGK
jgi:hypothetical protein